MPPRVNQQRAVQIALGDAIGCDDREEPCCGQRAGGKNCSLLCAVRIVLLVTWEVVT